MHLDIESSVVFHTEKKPLNICGPQVRRIRGRHRWLQPQFARECKVAGWDVSRDIIARIECQTRRVGDFELANLAQVLGVSVQDLLPTPATPKKKTLKGYINQCVRTHFDGWE